MHAFNTSSANARDCFPVVSMQACVCYEGGDGDDDGDGKGATDDESDDCLEYASGVVIGTSRLMHCHAFNFGVTGRPTDSIDTLAAAAAVTFNSCCVS